MIENHREIGAWPVFAALGHPIRSAIVERVGDQELPVTELARAFPVSLQAVSKHVQVLEAAGVVRRRVEGRTHWIGVDEAALERARAWLVAPSVFWAGRLSALAAALDDALTGEASQAPGRGTPARRRTA